MKKIFERVKCEYNENRFHLTNTHIMLILSLLIAGIGLRCFGGFERGHLNFSSCRKVSVIHGKLF